MYKHEGTIGRESTKYAYVLNNNNCLVVRMPPKAVDSVSHLHTFRWKSVWWPPFSYFKILLNIKDRKFWCFTHSRRPLSKERNPCMTQPVNRIRKLRESKLSGFISIRLPVCICLSESPKTVDAWLSYWKNHRYLTSVARETNSSDSIWTKIFPFICNWLNWFFFYCRDTIMFTWVAIKVKIDWALDLLFRYTWTKSNS